MRKLIRFEDGSVAIASGITITKAVPITDEVDLDGLSDEEFAEVREHRTALTIERDKDGRPTGLKRGKRLLRLGRPRDNQPRRRA